MLAAPRRAGVECLPEVGVIMSCERLAAISVLNRSAVPLMAAPLLGEKFAGHNLQRVEQRCLLGDGPIPEVSPPTLPWVGSPCRIASAAVGKGHRFGYAGHPSESWCGHGHRAHRRG